jgi:hypothetical protein
LAIIHKKILVKFGYRPDVKVKHLKESFVCFVYLLKPTLTLLTITNSHGLFFHILRPINKQNGLIWADYTIVKGQLLEPKCTEALYTIGKLKWFFNFKKKKHYCGMGRRMTM